MICVCYIFIFKNIKIYKNNIVLPLNEWYNINIEMIPYCI